MVVNCRTYRYEPEGLPSYRAKKTEPDMRQDGYEMDEEEFEDEDDSEDISRSFGEVGYQ